MKKIFLLSMSLILTTYIFAQDITGDWKGLLKVGATQLHLVFHVTKTTSGLTTSMDSPDQGANGIPLDKTSFDNKTLTFELSMAKISYTGTIDNAGVISGTFNQSGLSFPLVLSKSNDAPVLSSPKTEPKEPTDPNDITGEWNGKLKVSGMQLRLVFHISKAENAYSATMDSPDQGAKNLPMSKAKFENNTLTVEMASAGIEYVGKLDSGKVTGTFKQGVQSFPMVLTRAAIAKVEMKRPQEPVKPYPYYSEDVTFTNAKANITLAGTLTLPKKMGKFPVVVMITGSGAQNRDEELMGHKPFLVIADYLTRNGIGVLRLDDRGSFASKGDFKTATTFDFATDVEAAIEYLKTRKEIDVKHIGLIGHSEGGIIAPLVASRNKSVSFIVMLAGTAIPGSELLIRQQELIGRASGVKESDLKITKELNTDIYKLVDKISNNDTLKAKITNYLLAKSKELPELNIPEGKTVNDLIELQLSQLMTPWMLNFIRYNPAPTLEKVQCAVLAINGSKDLQVPASVNLPAIEKALKKSGNKHFTVKELPGLNHLFQECKTGLPAEYGEIEQTVSPLALETMTGWIKTTVNSEQ